MEKISEATTAGKTYQTAKGTIMVTEDPAFTYMVKITDEKKQQLLIEKKAVERFAHQGAWILMEEENQHATA